MSESCSTHHRSATPPRQPACRAAGEKIGLLAGWGDFPLDVARALKAQGYRTYCLGAADHADPKLAEICDHFQWIGLAKMGGGIRYFRQHGVRHVTMAGKIHKTILYQPWIWLKHLPDWRFIRRFYRHFILSDRDRRDDTLLRAIIDEFALDGIEFAPATNYAPELLVKYGQLTSRGVSTYEQRDIEFGWNIAKEMGRLDIGQSITIKGRAVLAVEAIEGTDECIRRTKPLCPSGGFTIVKVAKPQQDMRFDVPTIGLGTLRTMVESGARVLAIEAGRTIVLNQKEVVEFANRHKLTIVALEHEGRCELPVEEGPAADAA
ncbi:MAG: UDP-2,3-diacylglucosamine diphosphatase LpxI [Pirellulales bacterium]|nr:UDP-2,3-diacylglucosamine diphosphatase LpxI [Pirellulales bacterium]